MCGPGRCHMSRAAGLESSVFSAAVVNAFTTLPLAGNPAGLVLLDDDDRGVAWMQAVARDIGVSETGFLVPHDDGSYGLRWFTPTVEMTLCGHATLGAAHWLWERGLISHELRFHTRSGLLTATRVDDCARIWLDFPVVPITDAVEPCDWSAAFPGANLQWIGRTSGSRDLERKMLLRAEPNVLRLLMPDFARVATLPCGGVIVTSPSDRTDTDVLTRYFAPACGVDEDPVTGSAHCTVGWYWAPIMGKTTLRARQVSTRGGNLTVTVDGDRVHLGGSAVTVTRFEFE